MKPKNKLEYETEAAAKKRIEQVGSLKEQTAKGGLKFEAYLPSSLALWILDLVEKGIFVSPSEAVFVLLSQAKDLEPYDDIKQEILRRTLEKRSSESELEKAIPAEEAMKRIRESLNDKSEPAVWRKIPIE